MNHSENAGIDSGKFGPPDVKTDISPRLERVTAASEIVRYISAELIRKHLRHQTLSLTHHYIQTDSRKLHSPYVRQVPQVGESTAIKSPDIENGI